MTRNDTLNPEALRRPRTGRSAEYQVPDIMEHLGDGMAPSAWQRKCAEESGMSSGTFYRLLKEAKGQSLVRKDDKGCWVRGQNR
jgi:predicted transcriptional regulator